MNNRFFLEEFSADSPVVRTVNAAMQLKPKAVAGFAYFKWLGSPLRVCAPMVLQSDLPFRMVNSCVNFKLFFILIAFIVAAY